MITNTEKGIDIIWRICGKKEVYELKDLAEIIIIHYNGKKIEAQELPNYFNAEYSIL